MWSQPFLGSFELIDQIRRAQGAALGMLGFGPDESDYEIIASGTLWGMRRYAGPATGPTVLIVSSPIKRPYIWDLAPSASAIRFCIQHGLRVHLLEWKPPTPQGDAWGLADYADGAIGEGITTLSREIGAPKPFLFGHSLGGTIATIFAALHPERLAGLVILSTPLCLPPGVSAFRDRLAALAPGVLTQSENVPGSLLSQLSAAAGADTFVLSRLLDATASAMDPRASDIRRRVERWALDEVPLSGPLARDIFVGIYRENRLCGGALEVRGRTVRPSDLPLPMLAVANLTDDIAPPATVAPLLEAVTEAETRLMSTRARSASCFSTSGC